MLLIYVSAVQFTISSKKSHSLVAYITSLVDKSIDQSITRSVANHENQLRINDRRAI